MSTDYATGQSALRINVLPAWIINGQLTLPGSYITSHYDFLALALQVRIFVPATIASQSITLQVSSPSGVSWDPWFDLAKITILPSHATGQVILARVPENLAVIRSHATISPGVTGARRVLKLLHVANNTDATLNYDVEVFTTSRHE